ncbi:hypothetical protein BDZ45DRAFT_806111 [Acephala macrosclerotiorum]|nr:hypothetical protein BDZ45DRAFT_806111 [Acephala macrosclerotiorum]
MFIDFNDCFNTSNPLQRFSNTNQVRWSLTQRQHRNSIEPRSPYQVPSSPTSTMRGIRVFNVLYLLTLVTLASTRSVPNFKLSAISILLRSVPRALTEMVSVGKRQEYQVCAWLKQNQEFPCSWRATPVDAWTNFKGLNDLDAAQLGQVKEFRPSRRSSKISPESNSLRRRMMASFPEAAAIIDILGMAPEVVARVFQTFVEGKVTRQEHMQNIEREVVSPHCKWLDDSQSLPCRWNDPDINDSNQIRTEAGKLFTAQQNYGDEHPGYHGAASGLKVPRLFSFPVAIVHALLAVSRTMAAAIPTFPKSANITLKVTARETTKSQAVIQSQHEQIWCGLPLIWTYPCSWNAEDPHLSGVFMPYAFCKWVVLVPTNMISSLVEPFGLLASKADSLAKRSLDKRVTPLEEQGSNSSDLSVSKLSQHNPEIQDSENRIHQANRLSPTPTINDREVPTKTKRGWCLIPFLMFYPCWKSSPTATAVRYDCVSASGWKYWQDFPCDTDAFVDYSEAEPTGGATPATNSASNVGPPSIFRVPKILITFITEIAKTAASPVISAVELVQNELRIRGETKSEGKKQRRDCGGDPTDIGGEQCSAATSLTLPRIFTLPTLAFKLIGQLPGVLAATVSSFESSTNSEVLESIPDNDALASPTKTLNTREMVCASNGYNDATACFSDKSTASSLLVPRTFSSPILLFNAVGSIPGDIASLLKTGTSTSDEDVTKRTPPSQFSSSACKGTCDNPSMSASSCISSPRIFRLPTLLTTLLIAALPGAMAAVIPTPREFTESLTAPSFDLVRKSVSSLLGMIWISGHRCGSEDVSGDVSNFDSGEVKEGKPVVEAGRKEDELRRRQNRSLSSRNDCTNDVSFDRYCVKADAGRFEVWWALMGVLGLAGVFCFFM